MDGGILTLPVRVGIGGARVLLRTAETAAGCAINVGGKATVVAAQAAIRVSDIVTWGRPAPPLEPPIESVAREPAAPSVSDPPVAPLAPERSVNGDLSERFESPPATPAEPQRPPEPQRSAEPQRPAEPPRPPEPPRPREPIHVSEEPELVGEVAEPGAEDGAGAAVTVDEPWPEYARMTAKQVIARLADASPAELAAVQLYESVNRDRQTVRAAAERHLKAKTGRGSPN